MGVRMKMTALRAAFPHTIPVLTGFWFLAMAYGLAMRAAGFSPWYPMAMSLVVFGGSLEFLAISLLLAPFAPIQTLLLALTVQARHLFYGLTMLERFRGTGRKKPYLIFAMCDETFVINATTDPPEGVDRGWFMFFITLLNQAYWFLGATAGALLGSVMRFDTTGLDFVMTAMFVVIFTDQWLKGDGHVAALLGIVCTLACLVAFGSANFLLPAMLCIVIAVTLCRTPIEREGAVA